MSKSNGRMQSTKAPIEAILKKHHYAKSLWLDKSMSNKELTVILQIVCCSVFTWVVVLIRESHKKDAVYC